MRDFAVLFVAVMFAACSKAPDSATPVASSELRKAPPDSVTQFLLTSAANDFHSQPPVPVRFRDVRVGHIMNPSGEVQYFLCGEFLPAQKEGTGEWTPFATIQTSGYEQWIGAQAAGFCNGASVHLDDVGDLSTMLLSRLESLR